MNKELKEAFLDVMSNGTIISYNKQYGLDSKNLDPKLRYLYDVIGRVYCQNLYFIEYIYQQKRITVVYLGDSDVSISKMYLIIEHGLSSLNTNVSEFPFTSKILRVFKKEYNKLINIKEIKEKENFLTILKS